MKRKNVKLSALTAVAGMTATLAFGQTQVPVGLDTVTDFRTAVTQGVLVSPRVNADWYNFEATREAERGCQRGLPPQRGFVFRMGPRRARDATDRPGRLLSRCHPASASPRCCLTVSGTRDQVAALGFAKLVPLLRLQTRFGRSRSGGRWSVFGYS